MRSCQQDLTPYFLTAAHCVDTEEEARSVTAFWLYQTQTCNGELPDFQSVPHTEGASLLSTLGGGGRNPDGDMTLLSRIFILSLTRRQYTPALPRIPRTLYITSAGRRQGSSVCSQTLLERAERCSGRQCSLRNLFGAKNC